VTKSIFSARYETFRKELIKAREAAGFTQALLAAKLSKPQSFVSKYERGERRLDVIEYVEVAEALRIDPVRFMKKVLRTSVSGKRSS
jgi:transcriptional regulator with XRE-family HTH domain